MPLKDFYIDRLKFMGGMDQVLLVWWVWITFCVPSVPYLFHTCLFHTCSILVPYLFHAPLCPIYICCIPVPFHTPLQGGYGLRRGGRNLRKPPSGKNEDVLIERF